MPRGQRGQLSPIYFSNTRIAGGGHCIVSVYDPIKGAQLRVIRQNNFSVKITACVLLSTVNNSFVRVPARMVWS